MYDGDDYSLEGDMSVPSARKNTSQPGEPDFNTLDEPIKETIVSVIDTLPLNRYQTTKWMHLKFVSVSVAKRFEGRRC